MRLVSLFDLANGRIDELPMVPFGSRQVRKKCGRLPPDVVVRSDGNNYRHVVTI